MYSMTNEIAVPLHKDTVIKNSICRRQTRVSDSILTFLIYLSASISILILVAAQTVSLLSWDTCSSGESHRSTGNS